MQKDRNLRIIIVEDNENETQAFVECANNVDGIEIIATTNNSDDAITHIKSLLPDVVILDLELSRDGSGNGIEVLQAVKETPLTVTPYILVTTNNTSTQTTHIIRQLGADFIQYKHDKNYSANKIISILNLTKSHIINKTPTTSPSCNTSLCLNDNILTDCICTELNLIGMSNKLTGYSYLIDAIKLAISGYEGNLMKKVAKMHNTFQNNVEHSMRYAIEHTWNNSDTIKSYYTGHYSDKRGNPSSTELIMFFANKIQNRI